MISLVGAVLLFGFPPALAFIMCRALRIPATGRGFYVQWIGGGVGGMAGDSLSRDWLNVASFGASALLALVLWRWSQRKKRRKLLALLGHKATSALVHSRERVVVEGFDVQETARYRRGGKVDPKKKEKSGGVPGRVRADRNRALADTGIGIARWQLESKAAWYGCQVVKTGKHAPTGRACSACGQVKAKPVPPADELFTCEACGTKMPRRLNTARVLLSVTVAPSTGETLNARGGSVSPVTARGDGQQPSKREASTAPRGTAETAASYSGRRAAKPPRPG